ncbi:MAG: ATP-binding protein [Gemmatimonadaceae bacterium]
MTERDAAAGRLFAGAGEVRALCRRLDWSATPIGPVERWSRSLRAAVQMIMASGIPGVVLWGPRLIQIYNDAYAGIIRAKHPRALGRGNQEVWPEVWSINGPIFEQVLAGETLTFADARYPLERTGAGAGVTDDVYLSVSFSPILDDDGTVGGALAIMVETTTSVQHRALEDDRERLLGALRVEQSRLAAVFEQAPTFLAVLRGPTHVVTRINDAYQRLVGHRDIVGRPLAEALPEAVEQGFVAILDGVAASGEPFIGRELPILIQRTPGAPAEERFLDFVYQPLREIDAEGATVVTGIVAHGSDVTEQVLARRAVERAGDRATRLQALTADLAATTAPDDAADVVVAQGARATGAATGLLALLAPTPDSADEESDRFLVIVRQVGLDGVLQAADGRYPIGVPGPAAECIRTGEAIFCASGEDVIARYPDLLEVWERIRTQALATVPLVVADRVSGAMSFTFDEPRPFPPEERAFFLALGRQCAQALERAWLFAAERESHQRAERALAEAEAARGRAEEANRARADFLGVVSHELRTPLNAIGGYTELLELGIHGPVTQEQRRALARIQTSQRHLLGLINSVLNYTRVEAGAVHYDTGPVPLHEVLATCEALIAPQLSEHGLELENVACDAGLRALADRDKVQQIVLNLLSNSVKFTEHGGHVEVVCIGNGGRVQIHVADTGRGIPAEQLERVFQPFVQVDAKLTRTQGGVGLGLSISRDLARAMGGDLTAQSALGVGSIFTLTLPRAG